MPWLLTNEAYFLTLTLISIVSWFSTLVAYYFLLLVLQCRGLGSVLSIGLTLPRWPLIRLFLRLLSFVVIPFFLALSPDWPSTGWATSLQCSGDFNLPTLFYQRLEFPDSQRSCILQYLIIQTLQKTLTQVALINLIPEVTKVLCQRLQLRCVLSYRQRSLMEPQKLCLLLSPSTNWEVLVQESFPESIPSYFLIVSLHDQLCPSPPILSLSQKQVSSIPHLGLSRSPQHFKNLLHFLQPQICLLWISPSLELGWVMACEVG